MEVSLKSIILFMIRYVKGTCIFSNFMGQF